MKFKNEQSIDRLPPNRDFISSRYSLCCLLFVNCYFALAAKDGSVSMALAGVCANSVNRIGVGVLQSKTPYIYYKQFGLSPNCKVKRICASPKLQYLKTAWTRFLSTPPTSPKFPLKNLTYTRAGDTKGDKYVALFFG